MFHSHFVQHQLRMRKVLPKTFSVSVFFFFFKRLLHSQFLALDFKMNEVSCLLVSRANFQNRFVASSTLCVNRFSEVPPPVCLTWRTRAHAHSQTLAYAGKYTAERECGILEGFGAGGLAIVCSLHLWPLLTSENTEAIGSEAAAALKAKFSQMKLIGVPERGAVFTFF